MEGHYNNEPFLSYFVPKDRTNHRPQPALEELLTLEVEKFLHKLFAPERQRFLD